MVRRHGATLSGLALWLGIPVMAGAQPCQTPNDCLGLNGPCSLGSCVANQCQRQPINEGQSCTTPNPCVAPATCSSGYCVGQWQLNCCTSNPDCNDHNPCTTDTCANNVCIHGNTPAGTACGSQVDDTCTNPDTCDGNGQCLTNDVADGTDCGGPNCLTGQCGATTYRAQLLPEGNNIGSEALGMDFYNGDPDQPIIVGRVIDGSDVGHAVVWDRTSGGEYDLLGLEGAAGAASVAVDVKCNEGSGLCVAVGSAGTPAQPAAWVRDPGSGVWSTELMPLPVGFVSAYYTGNGIWRPDVLAVVGATVDPGGFRRATIWERSASGVWSVFLLPDYVVPGRESSASSIIVCPGNAPPVLCSPGARLIGGWSEDGPGVARPILWRETANGSGAFQLYGLPLPMGAIAAYSIDSDGDGITDYGELWLSAGGDPTHIEVTGTVLLTNGTIRAVIWNTDDFQAWSQTVLGPAEGHLNSYLQNRNPLDWERTVTRYAGGSFTDNDPSIDGVATQWILDRNTLALQSGPSDMKDLIGPLPLGCRAVRLAWTGETLQSGTWGAVLYLCGGPGVATAAGPPLPHAALAIVGPPAGIPVASAWGLAILSLLTLSVGVMVIRRKPQAGKAGKGQEKVSGRKRCQDDFCGTVKR